MVSSSDFPGDLRGVGLEEWVALREALAGSETLATIGTLGETGDDGSQVFGWAADAKFDADGNVLILDRLSQDVRVFDVAGRFLSSFGRSGDGPGEFRDPVGLEILPDGRVVVADHYGRLDVFVPADGGYVHDDRDAVLPVGEGLCYVRGRLYFSGWASETNRVIHEVSVSGKGVTRSFGQGYQSSYSLVQSMLTDGPIACLGDPPRIVFAFQQLPVLRGYSAHNGELIWTSLVEDYVQGEITEYRADGSVGYGSGVADVAVALTGVQGTFVLYQTIRGERAALEEAEVRSYLVDAASGNGAFISTTLPVVTEITDTHVLGYRVVPFSTVEIRRLASPGHEGGSQR